MSTIEHSPSAAKTPAFALVTEGWNEIVQEGLSPDGLGVTPFDGRSEVLFVSDNDREPVATVVYHHDPRTALVTIQLVYVEYSSRRRGYLRALLTDLTRIAKERGAQAIDATFPDGDFQAAQEARVALQKALPFKPFEGRHRYWVSG